jgi:hypothetical protein
MRPVTPARKPFRLPNLEGALLDATLQLTTGNREFYTHPPYPGTPDMRIWFSRFPLVPSAYRDFRNLDVVLVTDVNVKLLVALILPKIISDLLSSLVGASVIGK